MLDGVIDYDARSQAEGDKPPWAEKEDNDLVLLIDWRSQETPVRNKNVRITLPDGSEKLGPDREPVGIDMPDSDSGVLPRGSGRAQVNIWCCPARSGELCSVRRGHTEVRRFRTTVRGDRATIVLNGKTVIEDAQIPGLPAKGAIGLQHDGRVAPEGTYQGPPSLVQYRNIFIKEL